MQNPTENDTQPTVKMGVKKTWCVTESSHIPVIMPIVVISETTKQNMYAFSRLLSVKC